MKNVNYFIANDNGVILAHDIDSKAKAEMILSDYLTDNPNDASSGWEIIRDDNDYSIE